MDIPILRTDYSATNSGTALKLVRCEACSLSYSYPMTRSAVGRGTSFYGLDDQGASQRALERAREQLQLELAVGCDPVPCPGCGWYQAAMVTEAKRRHLRWLLWSGAVLASGSVLLAAFVFGQSDILHREWHDIVWWVAAVFAVVGVGALIARWICCRRHNPNHADQEARRQVGRQLSLPGEVLEQYPATAKSLVDTSPSIPTPGAPEA